MRSVGVMMSATGIAAKPPGHNSHRSNNALPFQTFQPPLMLPKPQSDPRLRTSLAHFLTSSHSRNFLTFVTDSANVTGMDSLLASAELSSSRDTRRQWNLIISRGVERIIVATYSRRNAETLADRLNELFTERPELLTSCEHCDMPIGVAPTGRPRRYCSDACRQAAWKLRRRDNSYP